MSVHVVFVVMVTDTESAASVNASLYIIQSLCNCDVSVKLEAIRQVLTLPHATTL